jgi:ATP-dependent Lon protease
MPDETMKIVVEGMGRGRIVDVVELGSHSEVSVLETDESDGPEEGEREALMRVALEHFREFARITQRVTPEVVSSLQGVTEPSDLADLICAHLPLRVEERQELLEIIGSRERLEKVASSLMREIDLQSIERKVRDRVREQMERSQREYYLHEQLKAIQQELGQREDGVDEYSELRLAIKKARMPKDVKEKANRELARYERMPALSPEGTVVRTYLDWLTELPWQKRSKDRLDLKAVKKQLDKDHYGLTKVKERILEYLAVRKLSKSTKGPILCLVGPPGVGKTSLGQSIAKAMGRKLARASLGGVRDEAEIRGHRRTYIGALPGRIIQSIKKAGVKNPVFVLDEIDKLSSDFRGDPSSALLEVLDPEQNRAFSDHYLEVDFDLHEIFFIATANDEYDIPHALHDRLEIVHLSSYTPHEKQRIAQLFLIPKQLEESGLTRKDISFTPEGIQTLIQRYTREAGVRELERRVAQVCRKVARKVVDAKKRPAKAIINETSVPKLLGPQEYIDIAADKKPLAGVAIGLAWTSTGGDILTIETTTTKGKGDLMLTGQLGEVMRESAQAAFTYLRARAKALRIPEGFYKNLDLHVHVPEGAIPKDGPSAGIPLCISMLSALRDKAPRGGIAMTGEITLRGRILPIGGLKEKVLAAHRAGLYTVMIPRENEKDLVEIPKEVRDVMEFVVVSELDEAIRAVFGRRPRKK